MGERRYYGMDALRGAMMMLGIVLHAALLYLADPPPAMPMITDRNSAYVFDIVFAGIHAFRMPTFFLLAGFFTALLVDKRGLAGTWKDRARRVLAPLAVGMFTILPLTGLLMIDFFIGAQYGVYGLLPDPLQLKSLEQLMVAKGVRKGEIPLAHLWFLYYLCWFYLLIPVCRWLVAQSLRIEARLQGWLVSPWILPPLAAFTAATLWPFHGGQVHEGFIFLRPHLPSLLYYGSFFVAGWFVHRYAAVLPALARNVLHWAWLSGVLFPVSLFASHHDNLARGADLALHLGAVLTNALCTWALICLFIGSAQRYFDRESPWIQYVSQSAYWVYLAHMPLVLLAGWWLVRYDWPAIVKFLLVCAFAACVALLSFHYAVQKTWLGNFLHGRRLQLDWPWKKVAGASP